MCKHTRLRQAVTDMSCFNIMTGVCQLDKQTGVVTVCPLSGQSAGVLGKMILSYWVIIRCSPSSHSTPGAMVWLLASVAPSHLVPDHVVDSGSKYKPWPSPHIGLQAALITYLGFLLSWCVQETGRNIWFHQERWIRRKLWLFYSVHVQCNTISSNSDHILILL